MEKFKNLLKNKPVMYCLFFVLTIFAVYILNISANLTGIDKFISSIEAKSYDFRFRVPGSKLEHNKDIVIVTIDDNSIELMEDEFGRWPWNRGAYTKAIKFLGMGGADTVAFDLMFLGYQKGFEDIDKQMAIAMGEYKNVYTSMNFDYRDNKKPPTLSDALKVNLENHSKNVDFTSFEYTNTRLILKDIIERTNNIGFINFRRDIDGISRRSPIFIKYQNDFYPYLAFKIAADYLGRHEGVDNKNFVVNSKNQVILGDRKVQLDDEGTMLINWYGENGTFEYIPFWKVIKSYNAIKKGSAPIINPTYFKDKIVFIGATATALFDIKSMPLSRVYPGVEIHASVLNNILDNTPMKKASNNTNFAICVLLTFITGVIVYAFRSSVASSVLAAIIAASYFALSIYLFKNAFIWIDVVNPLILMALSFTATYIIKYIQKSKDFDYTYKLATTDGLTGLHNHRYFQDFLSNSIENGKRYNQKTSLILIDIDFFKKFNDTYGHQAGDAVLRQVAQLLKKNVRAGDLVARYGGEEMAVVLTNTDTSDAIATANKLCNLVAEKPFKLSETIEKHVNISLGVATYPQHGESNQALIEFADQGLYRAKENGRNQVGSIDVSKMI